MKEDNEIEIAKLSMQMTLALLQDNKGHTQAFRTAHGLQKATDPMEIFDKVHDHLTAKISKE